MSTGLPFDVAAFLAEPMRPAQVSAVSPTGLPLLGSLWFLYQDHRFWFTSRLQSPLVVAMSVGSEVAVIVDEFEPPDHIRQIRVRGPGALEPQDRGRIHLLFRRYLGEDVRAWPALFQQRVADTSFALWSVWPSSGLIAGYPNFEASEKRWTGEPSPLP